jgi:hypothetical protein
LRVWSSTPSVERVMSVMAPEGIELGVHATKRAARALSSVRRMLCGRVRVEDILQFPGSRCTCDSFCLRPMDGDDRMTDTTRLPDAGELAITAHGT